LHARPIALRTRRSEISSAAAHVSARLCKRTVVRRATSLYIALDRRTSQSCMSQSQPLLLPAPAFARDRFPRPAISSAAQSPTSHAQQPHQQERESEPRSPARTVQGLELSGYWRARCGSARTKVLAGHPVCKRRLPDRTPDCFHATAATAADSECRTILWSIDP